MSDLNHKEAKNAFLILSQRSSRHKILRARFFALSALLAFNLINTLTGLIFHKISMLQNLSSICAYICCLYVCWSAYEFYDKTVKSTDRMKKFFVKKFED